MPETETRTDATKTTVYLPADLARFAEEEAFRRSRPGNLVSLSRLFQLLLEAERERLK